MSMSLFALQRAPGGFTATFADGRRAFVPDGRATGLRAALWRAAPRLTTALYLLEARHVMFLTPNCLGLIIDGEGATGELE